MPESWTAVCAGFVSAGAVPLALLVDRLWGEPPARWHPVVGMGRYLGAVGAWLVPDLPPGSTVAPDAAVAGRPTPPQRLRFVAGAAAWVFGAAAVALAAAVLQYALLQLHPVLAAGLLGLALKPLLAWRMLHDEVAAVEAALAVSLDAGRAQLARLVSRDVTQLGASEVRESAIETLAENLNDSVVAPLFWFVLLGLPGAAVYRFANTADAMWGYRGRWEWAGKWAAHADDVLSWLPARITAALLLFGAPAATRHALRAEARRTPSPNGGWPMGAMALRLGVRLAKPAVYTLNPDGRAPVAADTAKALTLAARAVVVAALLGTAVVAGIAWAMVAAGG